MQSFGLISFAQPPSGVLPRKPADMIFLIFIALCPSASGPTPVRCSHSHSATGPSHSALTTIHASKPGFPFSCPAQREYTADRVTAKAVTGTHKPWFGPLRATFSDTSLASSFVGQIGFAWRLPLSAWQRQRLHPAEQFFQTGAATNSSSYTPADLERAAAHPGGTAGRSAASFSPSRCPL